MASVSLPAFDVVRPFLFPPTRGISPNLAVCICPVEEVRLPHADRRSPETRRRWRRPSSACSRPGMS